MASGLGGRFFYILTTFFWGGGDTFLKRTLRWNRRVLLKCGVKIEKLAGLRIWLSEFEGFRFQVESLQQKKPQKGRGLLAFLGLNTLAQKKVNLTYIYIYI